MSHVDEGTLHAMLDGELTGEEATAVNAHLDRCASCHALLDQVKAFIAEADTLIVVLDDPETPQHRGLSADGGAVAWPGGARPWWRRPQFLAAAATITLAIGAGYIGLALKDQAIASDQTALMSEAEARTTTPDGPAVDSPARQFAQERPAESLAPMEQAAGKDDVAVVVSGENRAEPSPTAREREGAGAAAPVPAAVPAAPADDARDELADAADPDQDPARRNGNEDAPVNRAALEESVGRLDGSIKLIDGRRPIRIEQEPAPILEGATTISGLVRVVYQDEEDREFVLEQVKVSFDSAEADGKRNQAAGAQKAEAAFAQREAFLRITPNDTVISTESDSTVRIRWVDTDGLMLALIGVNEAFLREMMARIK